MLNRIQKEMEKECYEEEVQPYRKLDYKPIIIIIQIINGLLKIPLEGVLIEGPADY